MICRTLLLLTILLIVQVSRADDPKKEAVFPKFEMQEIAKDLGVGYAVLLVDVNGDASIVWNRPGTIYYVVLLTDIHRPDEAAFYRDYSNPHVLGDNLWRYMEAERRKQFHRATMEQLRADAGAPKGKWDVPDDIRKRIEGRDSGDDE